MALEAPNNKMMTDAPAKKGFHFAATAEYLAEYIEAATTEEAEAIYHKVKRIISDVPADAASARVAPASASEQSPASQETAQETNG